MTSRTRLLRLTLLGTVTVLALALMPAASAHRAEPGPVNAQTRYGWGKPQWQDKFVGPRKKIWRVRGRGNVQTQHGMLTLNTAKHGSTSATLKGKGHRTGRWMIRLRSRAYEQGHHRYRVRTELIPAGAGKQHCGAKNVGLENYQLGHNRAHFFTRTRPAHQFTDVIGRNLGTDRWHTFAVEITPKRISWFVDAHVRMTERRPKALSGVRLTPRFTMVGRPGKRMNQGRMQMDWLRYFTLDKPNKRSIEAPRADRGTYAHAC